MASVSCNVCARVDTSVAGTKPRRPAKSALGRRLLPGPRRPGLGEMKSAGGPAEDSGPDQDDGRRRAHQVSELGPVEVWLVVIAERGPSRLVEMLLELY
ncbi:hypothetical protein ON010_g18748 [Phytophthora cinnamomi]|nr:hypothetical protein ON010_g18748 [Phytophthora cinnamomi]